MQTSAAQSAGTQLYSLLIGPLAWAADEGLSYATVYHACSTGHHYVLHIISLSCMLLALSGALQGWRQFQAVSDRSPEGGNPLDRTHFMSILGIAASIGFCVVILALAVPKFILSPCD